MKFVTLLIGLLFITGCATMLQVNPQPTKSRFFITQSGGFRGTYDEGNCIDNYYTLSLKPRKEVNDNLYLKVCFENPSDSNKPIYVDALLNPTDDTVFIDSPIMKGFKNSKNYRVIVYIYSDQEKTQLVGQHKQLIRFFDPTRYMKK